METTVIHPPSLSEFGEFEKPEIKDFSDLELFEMYQNKFGRSVELMAKFFGCTKATIESLKINFKKIQLDLREKFLATNADNPQILALVEVEIQSSVMIEKLHQSIFDTLQKRVDTIQSDLFETNGDHTDELIKILNATKDYAKNTTITEETIQRTNTGNGNGIDTFQRRIQAATSL